MQRQTQMTVALAAVLAAGLCGCAPVLANSKPPAGPAGTRRASGEASPAANPAAVADAAAQTEAARFPGLYAGEVLADHGTVVVIYLTRLERAAETAIAAGTPRGVVRFARAPRSLAYLDRLHQRVTSEQAELKRQGTNIVTWGPDFVTGRENLTVQDLDPAKTALLDQLFGAANLTLSNTSRSYTACGCAATPKNPGTKLPVPVSP
jgi:hypothetical protein